MVVAVARLDLELLGGGVKPKTEGARLRVLGRGVEEDVGVTKRSRGLG